MSVGSLVFLSGKRTPFGAFGGKLKRISPIDLGVTAARAAFAQAQVTPTEMNHVIVGNVLHTIPESIYIPRHLGLKAGVSVEVPALGINRLCGSGFQTIVEAFHQMLAGDTRMALVAGVESMSMAPYVVRGTRWGMKMGHSATQDLMLEAFFDTYAEMQMGMTAENLADQYGITREQSDAFALRSQQRYQNALSQGFFQDEIVPLPALAVDEHPRSETTLEKLSILKPVFKKDGRVTAGNASGIVDGAAALVVSTEKEAEKRGLPPLGRLVSYGISGCDPKKMGIGPAPAIREALLRAKMDLSQIDLIEVNEAFAPQALAVQKELGIPDEIFNVNGGAIAVGHPLAASGIRIVQNLLYELRRRKKRYALGSACIGGGQGIAMLIEST